MTRRERIEARLERRRDWAASRDAKAAAAHRRFHSIADGIPLGQPILVGHHSERHARRDAARIDAAASAAVENTRAAADHRSKAAGIAAQLDRTIFSDDENATDALEAKAAAIEAACERMKRVNAAFRKAPGADKAAKLAACVEAGTMTRDEAMEAASLFGMCHWEKQPFPAYALSNRRANARRCLERVKAIKHQNEQRAKAEAAPGSVLIEAHGADYCGVTFPEYPGRDVVQSLKAAGYHWSAPSWYGNPAELPECVRDMAGGAS